MSDPGRDDDRRSHPDGRGRHNRVRQPRRRGRLRPRCRGIARPAHYGAGAGRAAGRTPARRPHFHWGGDIRRVAPAVDRHSPVRKADPTEDHLRRVSPGRHSLVHGYCPRRDRRGSFSVRPGRSPRPTRPANRPAAAGVYPVGRERPRPRLEPCRGAGVRLRAGRNRGREPARPAPPAPVGRPAGRSAPAAPRRGHAGPQRQPEPDQGRPGHHLRVVQHPALRPGRPLRRGRLAGP